MAGIQKDVLVWSLADLSTAPVNGSSFTVIGTPDLMAFKDGETVVVPADFNPSTPSTIDADQTLSGTLEGVEFRGNNATTDVFEFEVAFEVTDGTNTFNIYQIDNDQYGGTTVAYVSEVALQPGVTYSVVREDISVNSPNGTGYETTPVWSDLAGQVDGTSGNDVIGAGFVDDDDDRIDGNDGLDDVILGEGGDDSISAGAGNDLIYGDHNADLPAGTTEYLLQGFFRDVNFELESGSLRTDTSSLSISGAPLEVRFIDNDTGLGDDNVVNETPTDTDQQVEINGVLYSFAPDFVIQFNGSDSSVYDLLVIDVDRNFGGNFDNYTPTSDPGDTDYEHGQILIPIGAVPPPGTTLTSIPATYEAPNPAYTSVGGVAVSSYNDTIDAGAGDDSAFGGRGDDRFIVSDGNDTVFGGETGETAGDTLDASGDATAVTVNYSGNEAGTLTDGSRTTTFNEIEGLALGSGGDTVDAGADGSGVSIDGGSGNDTITGGTGADTLVGGDGDDLFLFEDNFGNDAVFGGNVGDTDTINFMGVTGTGVDVTFSQSEDGTASDGTSTLSFDNIEAVTGSNQADTLNAGADNSGVALSGEGGNDTITGGSDNDTIDGGSGNDTIDGGSGNDTIQGGAGNDTLTGGLGDDLFIYTAGDGADVITDFNAGNTGTLIDGNPSNNDRVDLSSFYTPAAQAAIEASGTDSFSHNLDMLRQDAADGTLDGVINGTDYSAQISDIDLILQNGGAPVTEFDLTAENTNVTCFTTGTDIKTATGETKVEDLSLGDRILTLDNGYQPIRWIGRRYLAPSDLAAHPNLRPIRICAGALGRGLPERDLLVSPQHRILVSSRISKRMFGDAEVLIAATHLTHFAGISVADDVRDVTYFHFLFDRHEVVFSNGAKTESLFTGPQTLKSLHPDALAEILAIFPQLAELDYAAMPCRQLLIGKSARNLTRRHLLNKKPLLSAA